MSIDAALSRRSALALGAAGGLSSCAAQPAAPRDLRSISLSIPNFVTTLDAATSFLQANQLPADLAYERLLRYRVVEGRVQGLEGELAEAWELAPDRSSLTFHLRKGRRFDDGTEVTSEAVRFTFDRIRKAKLLAAPGLFWYGGTDTPDPYTARVKLRFYAPFVPFILAAPGLGVVNPAVMRHAEGKDYGSGWLARNTAGSGAYRVRQFTPREEVVLEPNPHAPQRPRFFNEVRIRSVSEETARAIEIAKGDVDILESVSPFYEAWLKAKSGVRVVTGPSTSVSFLSVNNEREPFNDPRVRRAISLAINRDEMIRSIQRGQARLLHGSLPADIPGADPSIPLPTYNPDQARDLLRQAGVAPGHPVTLTRVADSSGPSATVVAIQSYLEAVGFKVSIRQINAAARSQVLAGDFDMTLQSITLDFPDPWIVMSFAYGEQSIGATNMARYRNPQLDAMLMRADELDGEARAAVYRRAQRIVANDLPTIPLFQTDWAFAVRDDIKGVNYNFAQPMYFNFRDMYRA